MKQRQNSEMLVGRAGHDPATYGLKGRANRTESPSVLDERNESDPSVAQVGSVVEVTSGLRKGQRGVVLEVRPTAFHGVPDLAVQFEDGHVRTLRSDFAREMP